MITSDQIRAARALLRWSAQKLADESGVSWKTIQRMETADSLPTVSLGNVIKARGILELAGVEFIDEDTSGGPGVRFQAQAKNQRPR
jgi:ribosome-binding protein aMBF1 (putative translation factor)